MKIEGSLHAHVFSDDFVPYGTIYIDPPWKYGNQATRNATDRQYPTMSLKEIAALPIGALALPDAHIHVWTTNAFYSAAERLIEQWGFTYKSTFVWVKPQMGMGNYYRNSHEYLLFGLRGKAPFGNHSTVSWAQYDRTRHSAKPAEIRAMVERVSPGPRIELFAREAAAGWDCWGNEAPRG